MSDVQLTVQTNPPNIVQVSLDQPNVVEVFQDSAINVEVFDSPSIPSGGNTNDVLTKASNSNFDYVWSPSTSGVDNVARIIGNTAFDKANSANYFAYLVNANTVAAFDKANSANYYASLIDANTIAAFIKANSANYFASLVNANTVAAFNVANTKFSSSGGSINGDVSISGNLTISGNTSFINVSNYRVDDSLIYLAGNNYTSDIVDIGFVGNYSNGACTTLHTGVFRDAGSKEWYFFENYAREPENNVIDPNGNNFTISVLNATLRTSNIILAGINAVSWISSAYDKANSAAQTVPQNAQNSNYTLTLGDAGKYIYYTQGTSVNLYIPTTGNVAFPNGTSIMIVSRTTSSANITITPNSGVSLFLAGNSTSATRNVTTYGMATLMHVEANTWFINGTGIV